MNYLDKLNLEQKKAVETTLGPVLIIAGAGAGKTRTLTFRIAHLINQGVDPKNILAVTFTNKASNEMQERVDEILKNELGLTRPVSEFSRPTIKTFHSLGVHILKNHADSIGFNKSFSIYDRSDSKKIIREITKDLGLDPKEIDPNKVISVISRQKGDKISPTEYEDSAENNYVAQNISQIWRKYDQRLKEENAFDFDDLLSKTVEILTKDKAVREYYQSFYEYVHVDEYQDTNSIQYEITKILSEKHKNICVVGDIDQNIYSWRGASIHNMLNFNEDYPDATIIKLEENYRSSKNILEAANQSISKNRNRIEKKLFTNNGDGEKIYTYNAIDEYDEARFAVRESKKLISEGMPANEIAFLFRANFQSRVLEEICLQEKLPHQVLGTRFFDRKEIKDVIAYLKTALNQEDFSNLSRIINYPTRGIGKTTLLKIKLKQENNLPKAAQEKLLNFRNILLEIKRKAEKSPLSETIAFIIKKSTIEERLPLEGEDGLEKLDNLKELVSLAKKYDLMSGEDAVSKFLEDVALATDQDSLNKDNGGVKLMTVHAAKGLEFDAVFITGLETGLFPFIRQDDKKDDAEEERRLFYVAVTRARKKLFLVKAMFRTIFGRKEITTPSEFLEDISEDLLEDISNLDSDGKNLGKMEYLIDF